MFNLGHGVLPATDPDQLARLVDLVHTETVQHREVDAGEVRRGRRRDRRLVGGLGAGRRPERRAEVTVYEPGQLGGKLRTTQFLGRPVDEGPDSLSPGCPKGLALCQELGLERGAGGDRGPTGRCCSPGESCGRSRTASSSGHRPRLLPLLRSRILSAGGMARASFDLVLPAFPARQSDVSVFNLIASRFGREVAERLVEPLLGSIHAGSTRQLSAAATAPQLLAAAQASRSLIARAPADADPGSRQRVLRTAGPLFVAPRQGMQALADRLVERLGAARRHVRPG